MERMLIRSLSASGEGKSALGFCVAEGTLSCFSLPAGFATDWIMINYDKSAEIVDDCVMSEQSMSIHMYMKSFPFHSFGLRKMPFCARL